MKLAAALLLVASQLSVQVESQGKDVGCEDNDVFRAVDAALTNYNNQQSSGPQFVLYRIMTASLKDSSEHTFAITYEIRESNCMIETGKNWKECNYKDSANREQGECTAIVKSQNEKEFNVIEQNCHIIPAHDVVVAVRGSCLGCFHLIPTNDSDLEAILKHALQSFNEKSKHEHLFDLKEVVSASRQVVNGWNYKVQYSIMQTDCLKKEDGQLSPKCKPVPQGEISICSDFTHVDPQMKISILSQTCNPRNDSESSVTQKMSVHSPELNEPLRHSLEKFNSENKSNFYFKINTILKAESLMGSRPKYTIEFLIRETECSKEKDKYSENCALKESGDILECIANVSVEDASTFNPTVHCKAPTQTLMKRPPGFSPFRAAAIAPRETQAFDIPEQEEEQAPGKELGLTHSFGHGHRKGHDPGHGKKDHPGLGLDHKHGHNYSQGHGYGRKRKHGEGRKKHEKKDKKKHGSQTNEHLDSPNEEHSPSNTQEETQGPPPPLSSVLQGATVPPFDLQDLDLLDLNPTNPPSEPTTEKKEEKSGHIEDTEDDWIPDIPVQPKSPLFTLVPDFPEPSASKCPGHPWKPIDVIDPVREESPYLDFDLSDALEYGKK